MTRPHPTPKRTGLQTFATRHLPICPASPQELLDVVRSLAETCADFRVSAEISPGGFKVTPQRRVSEARLMLLGARQFPRPKSKPKRD